MFILTLSTRLTGAIQGYKREWTRTWKISFYVWIFELGADINSPAPDMFNIKGGGGGSA